MVTSHLITPSGPHLVKFEKEIENELSQLCLNQARFKIQIQPCELNNTGIDNITFMIATNKGQNLTLLTETASGGEISRIMLAIKIIILSHSSLETIIFDEVDTGVSGKIASSIGERMNLLSKNKQVICITHLPQVACYAHTHYSIVKDSDQINTISSIKKLNVNERILEIAKMLSGEKITNEAIENAKQLLNV